LILLVDLLEEARSLCAGERLLRTLCQDRLALFVQQRAAYWKQPGKFRMIREGDANTKFFHVRASQCLRRNKIQTIVDAAEQCHVSHAAKSATLTAHFSSLLGEADSVTWDFDVASLYSQRQQVQAAPLVAPFTGDEAPNVVSSMNANSAPSPDGIGHGLYKAAWRSVGKDVMHFLNAFHAGTS